MDIKEKYKKDIFQHRFQKMQGSLKGQSSYVPVYGQIHEYACSSLSISPKIFYSNPESFITGILDTTLKFQLDFPNHSYDVYNIEAETLGMKVLFPESGSPLVDYSKPLIKTPEDLDLLKTPDPKSSGRMPFVTELNRLYTELTGLTPNIRFTAPFSLACIIRGYSQFITDIMTNPDFAHQLLVSITDKVLIPFIGHLVENLAPKAIDPLISGADAWASIPNVNISILEEFNIPYIERIRNTFGKNVVVRNWVGESKMKIPEPFLKLKLKASPTLLLAQDPDVELLGPEFFSEFASQQRVPLILGIGASFLRTSSIEKTREKTHKYCNIARNLKGFALYLCNIEASTPPKNIEAVVDIAHNW